VPIVIGDCHVSETTKVFKCWFFQDLRALISNALIEAEQHNYVSLALPAVGTGNLKYPRHIVAKVIVEEIVSFSQQHPHTKLKDVRIVLFPQDLETIQVIN